MSSYGMCPYVLCILHSTRFWYKRRGFAVINIDIISYLVVKNRDTSFQTLLGVPCREVDPLLWKCERRVCEWGKKLNQPVGGDLSANLLVVIC